MTVHARPFIVSSGAKDFRISSSGGSHDPSALPRRSIMAGPRSSRLGPSLIAAAPRKRNPSAEVPAAAVDTNVLATSRRSLKSMGANISRRASTMKEILQQEQKQKQKQKQQQALTSVGGTIPEAGGAPRGIASVNVLATSRRSSSVTSMGARISRRASTMKEMLQQQQKQTQKQQLQQQQQPVKPIGKNNRIQMERQQRRNRGLNLGLSGNFFGARDKTAQEMFRGLPALPGDALCSDDDAVSAGGKGLWSGSGGTEDGFLLSRPVEKVDCFVSHTWARDRRDPMFRNSTEFVGFKAAELKEALEDVAAEKRASKKPGSISRLDEMLMKIPTDPLVLWIDKFCVSPDVLERRLVIERHMEHFLANSDGFLVLLSSCYFQRLWCVYEWGCFIATHGTNSLDRIRVCVSWLCCSSAFQIPLLAYDLERLSIARLNCSELNDQLYLRSRISAKYQSVKAFERMVQVSAICSLSKSFAVLTLDFCTAGQPELEDAWRVFNRHLRWRYAKFLLPWRSVAEKLGLRDVCSGLDKFWDQLERTQRMSAEGVKLDDGSDLYCVSAPSRHRLRIFANSASQMYLSVLVRKARSAAVIADGLAGVAISSLSKFAAETSASAGSRQRVLGVGGALFIEETDENEDSGSQSSGCEERGNRFSSGASEAF